MSEGLNFWYGIVFFILIVAFLVTVGSVLSYAAMRLALRDDVFEEPRDADGAVHDATL